MPLLENRIIRSFVVVCICFLLLEGGLFAQGTRGPKAPGARAPSGPRTSQPRGNSGGKAPDKQRPTQKDLEDARIRERERRERAEEGEEPDKDEAGPQKDSARKVEYLPLDDDDLRILSVSWNTEAKRGNRPFTVLKMKVANRTENLLSLERLRLVGRDLVPFRDQDDRPLPRLPSRLDRFGKHKGLSRPIQPHSTQTLTFAFPYALKPGSDFKAEVDKYVKFKTSVPFEWNPIKVIRWTTCQARSGGISHQGLFVTVENKCAERVTAKLKVTLDGFEAAGGRTFFFRTVSLGPKERKNMALRTIPDEGAPLDDPTRQTMPASFKVQRIEVVDILY